MLSPGVRTFDEFFVFLIEPEVAAPLVPIGLVLKRVSKDVDWAAGRFSRFDPLQIVAFQFFFLELERSKRIAHEFVDSIRDAFFSLGRNVSCRCSF